MADDSPTPALPRFLTVRDVAKVLQVSSWLVRQIIKRGELKVHVVGRNQIRITPEAFESYKQSIAVLPPGEKTSGVVGSPSSGWRGP